MGALRKGISLRLVIMTNISVYSRNNVDFTIDSKYATDPVDPSTLVMEGSLLEEILFTHLPKDTYLSLVNRILERSKISTAQVESKRNNCTMGVLFFPDGHMETVPISVREEDEDEEDLVFNLPDEDGRRGFGRIGDEPRD
jgi:hypothetical protein